MGEMSQQIGKKLERFGAHLLMNIGWEGLGSDIHLDCNRTSHKRAGKKEGAKSGTKISHGIDILCGYDNPFTARKEAIIVECKNHQWADFIPSRINQWIDELVNTIECASSSPTASLYLKDHVLSCGLLLFNSSDNKYDSKKAEESLSKISVPRRRSPIMIYIADTGKLERWNAIHLEIAKIKQTNKNNRFKIIYPSIGGSDWEGSMVMTPSYLFSDYLIFCYEKTIETDDGEIKKIDVKGLFCFDCACNASFLYLGDMINILQLEARGDRKLEVHIYFYPQDVNEADFITAAFSRKFGKEKPRFILKLLDNRRLSPVDQHLGE